MLDFFKGSNAEKEDKEVKEDKEKDNQKAESDDKKEKDEKKDTKEKEASNTLDPTKLIKKGDYSVHILVEEIKNAVCKKEDQLPRPVIKMTCFEKSQRTAQLKNDCSDNIFNEHFYFEKSNLTVNQLDKEKILIEVYDYKNTSRKDYLGMYELDLEVIYDHEEHSYKNFWLALANPESDDITKINGYLKLSISVLNDNDPRVELLPNDDDKDSKTLIPSQIKQKYKQIKIEIYKGEELPDDSKADKKVNKSCQCFIEVKYMGATYSTRIVNMENDIVLWNQVIYFGVSLPTVSKVIDFRVNDKDKTCVNYLGSFSISLDDILNDKFSEFFYAHNYGSSGLEKNYYYTEMNKNSKYGSKWKGRILMRISATDSDKPLISIEENKDKTLTQKASNTNRNNLWILYIKLYEAYFLPYEDENYSVTVSIQGKDYPFAQKKAILRTCTFNLGNRLQCLTVSEKVEEIPDIFIYLLDKNKNILCFQRLKAKNVYLNKDTMMIKLIPEPSIGIVKDNINTGIIKIKLTLINHKKDYDTIFKELNIKEFSDGDNNLKEEKSYDSDDLEEVIKHDQKDDNEYLGFLPSKKMEQQIKTYYYLSVNVYMSRYLISGDPDGTSDLYVSVTIGDQERHTKTKSSSVNGIWNEKLLFSEVYFDINDKSTYPVLFLKVMDHDFGTKDDFLCYNYIWLSDMSYKINQECNVIKPKWHQLLLTKSNKKQGQILLSCFIFDPKNAIDADKYKILPDCINYKFEYNILGLRNLLPLSIIPIKKPFISFDLNSINYNSDNTTEIPPIKTEPKESGSSPNITSIIKFSSMLPKDKMFMPTLQCEVLDYILNGFIKKHIGVFEINLVDLLNETIKGISMDLEVIRQNQLNNIDLKKGSTRNQNNQMDNEDNNVNNNQSNSLRIPLVSNENSHNNEEDDDEDNDRNKFDQCITINRVKDLNRINTKYIDTEEIENNAYNSAYFVIKPVFKIFSLPGIPKGSKDFHQFYVEDEDKMPDDSLYFPLGFNKYDPPVQNEGGNEGEGEKKVKETVNKKHYRRIFKTELEKVKQLGLASPFLKCKIFREKFNDKEDKKNEFFQNMSDNLNNKILKVFPYNKELSDNIPINDVNDDSLINEETSDSKSYGDFKTVAQMCPADIYDDYMKKIKEIKQKEPYLLSKLNYYSKYENISKKILIKKSVVIRVYILKISDLAKKDSFSDSDPYIKISLGSKKDIVNEQINHFNDMSTVNWYKYYDIPTELPGNGSLEISVYDYDPMFSDDLIGSTTIDVEDRYFDNIWNNLAFKPIEIRNLYHPDFKNKQGNISLFLEIFNKNDKLLKEPWNIETEPECTVQIRLIVWETEDIANLDIEDTSDVYVIGYLENNNQQSTDIHFRCQTGVASFNWRMIFNLKLPSDKYKMNLIAYDNDFLARDDFIGKNSFNIKDLIKNCETLCMPIKFTRSYYNDLKPEDRDSNIEFLSKDDDSEGTKFWVQLYKYKQQSQKEEKAGRVMCSIEVLPTWYAEASPAGEGRNDPNINPYLPPPTGRIKFTLNPFSMINQFVGPKFRSKCKKICIITCCVVYWACVIPFIIYFLAGELANPFNYIKKGKKSK